MDLKKYMKLKSEKVDEGLAERDKARYDALYAQVQANEAANAVAKKRVDAWKIITPIATCVAAVIITVTCIFAPKGNNDILYKEENIKSEHSSYVSLKSDLKYFDFNRLETVVNNLLLMTDTKSNDKLYYRFKAYFELCTLNCVVVINEKYNYKFDLPNGVNYALSDYNVIYQSEIVEASPILEGICYKGKIQVQTEIVYFEYTQLPALGDEAFFESIQQIIQVKK